MNFISLQKWLVLLLMMAGVVCSYAQCADGQITLSINIYTDGWPNETYWELVPGTNACGDGTIIWGSNQSGVGCPGNGDPNGAGDQGYPGYGMVQVTNICLNEGEYYTLYFVDSFGDGGLYFETFEDGAFSGFYSGTGAGNMWTFQTGVSFLGAHDSPCNAQEVVVGSAIELSNVNCYSQVNEVHAPQGNCQAMGVWCPDEINHTAWAKFTVPDDGAYEISTVHPGTSINTQMAIWYAEDCMDMSSYIYISGNDDFMGESGIAECNANPPSCVDRGSAAYFNVLQAFPACCETGWDDACQTMYDAMSGTCLSEEQTCTYTIEGMDTYGDGWNGNYITVTVDGVSEDYTLNEGSSASWTFDVASGSSLQIEFVAGDWPEEVVVILTDPSGQELLNVQPVTVEPLLFDAVLNCNGSASWHPQSSRCYTHCLPAGMTLYIQIDGYNNEWGDMILSVVPYENGPVTEEVIQGVLCPVGVGIDPEGMILPNVTGWGMNYTTNWTGPNGFVSDAYFLENIGPGTYTYHAEDACGAVVDEVYVVEGPSPFELSGEAQHTCAENTDGSVAFSISGGTAPYSYSWHFPDGTEHEGEIQSDLPAGMYYLYLEDDHGCFVSLPVEVETLPATTVDLGEDLTLCSNFDILISGPDVPLYSWSTGDVTQQVILSGEEYPVGEYDIELNVINEFGCASSDSLHFEVLSCIAVNEMSSSPLVFYPNPANEQLYIQLEKSESAFCRVFDATGILVLQKQWSGSEVFTLNTAALAAGMYVITIESADQVLTQSFNVQH
ncbi:MAG: T9SS type A sorting domain-containing protein [Flavobacteriales bacterium]